MIPESRFAIIEARDNSHEWDSDYVGTEPYTIAECREYVKELESDPDWEGWQFRIMAEDEDGCYCLQVPMGGAS